MGRKSATVTSVVIVDAFRQKRRWLQSALAKYAGITPKRLRRHLLSLRREYQWPLAEAKAGRDCEWSLPDAWHPAGVHVPEKLVPDLVRLLLLARGGKARDRLAQLVQTWAQRPVLDGVAARDAGINEDEHLSLVHDAQAARVPLRMLYRGGNGVEKWRTVSVQRLLTDDVFLRFFAMCHEGDKELKEFRVDRIAEARLSRGDKFIGTDPAFVDKKIKESVGGMNEGAPLQELYFFVKDPESNPAFRSRAALRA